MKITVIGTGYVGLVTGACLAEIGNDVLCADIDARKIDSLNTGRIPIYEPGLEGLLKRNAAEKRLSFTTDIRKSVDFGEIQFIAVGTPPDEDGSADLRYVIEAARNIGRHMNAFRLIVNKSTVLPGTADKVKQIIKEELSAREIDIAFSVASNPEFLKEGAAIDDFMRPDRIVIGVDDERAARLLRSLYAPFQRNHERLVLMDTRSAELTKYAANAMLATRISFMNELALLAEKLGADIDLIRRGIGSDSRIGYHFLYAGCGYGGSCFPKDIRALRQTARENGLALRIMDAVEEVNATQKNVLADKIFQRFGDDLANRRFALWGLAFKPNTDDMREAPSRILLEALWRRGAAVSVFDPAAMGEARRLYGERSDLIFAESPMEAIKGADALLIVTEWKAFRSPDFGMMKSLLKQPVIFDGRNLYEPSLLREQGFEYFSIGRAGRSL
ncbi:MAG: UDP-glucose/GDP-mannose dehydrogenase family protein [Candidatus Accumulibacter sp.]|jgi:UDPglucose 6-dehydrogenase|nr:UDP-glucose/GDP-mannose dehydrogenase family protein [Accumulibacter sp.]